MAYPANLAVTNWGSLQSGNTADLDTNFRNVVVALNGIGNGTSVLQTVAITTAGITNANIATILGGVANLTTMNAANVVIFGGIANVTTLNASNITVAGVNLIGVTAANASATIVGGAAIPGTATTFMRSDAAPALALTVLSSTLGADSNIGSGPVSLVNIAQGTSGTWFVSGYVTFIDTAGATQLSLELTDGITNFASGTQESTAVNIPASIHISGKLVSPAGSISLVAKATGSATVAKFNQSGWGHDTQITAFRIG